MDGQVGGWMDGCVDGAGWVSEKSAQTILGTAQCKGEKAASLGAMF